MSIDGGAGGGVGGNGGMQTASDLITVFIISHVDKLYDKKTNANPSQAERI